MKRYLILGLVALAATAGDALAFGRGGGRGGGARPAPTRSGSGSFTTQRGGTVNYAGAGRGGTTPGGVNYGRGAGAVQVTTPGGHTATRVGSGGVAQGPGGRTVGGSRGATAVQGAGGNSAFAANRGGVAVGPGGAVAGGSRVGGVSTPHGTYAGASHHAAAFGHYGGVAVGRGGAVVAGPGGVAARHATFAATPSYVAARGTAVRGGYAYHSAYFNPGWYTAHPAAWTAARLTAAAVWTNATYATAAAYVGAPAEPVSYDYGTTVVYQDNDVYVEGEKVATADEFATQATAIADTGRAAMPPADEEWKPLGVFGLVQAEDTVANTMFQLAVNKDGVIRGNYYDALGDNTLPVYGSVDKKTGRAAWSVGEKKEIVYEAGLSNVTQPECTVLIHYGKEKTRQMLLVRIEDPKAEAPPTK